MKSPDTLRIALDAMGGDHAPRNEVEGARKALDRSGPSLGIILVGDEAAIRAELSRQGSSESPALSIVHASQVITMEDPPTASVKLKKDSSLAVGMRLHKEGRAEAFASAGNTGAVLSASTLILGRVRGVSRPTIGAFIPSEHGKCLVLDAGTNVDCRPRHLYEFAVMGSIYYRMICRKERPSVALLNVGEEKTKGTEAVLEAHRLLSGSALNFIGNVEGRDILRSTADVVVCDGFVGNIILKFAESVPGFLKTHLRRFAETSLTQKLQVGIAAPVLKKALSDMDPNGEGGVPVLGVNGVSIIGHGSSSPRGIMNMILRAAEVAASRINQQIEEELAGSAMQPTVDGGAALAETGRI
ncbi:MAG TPA: phosphate acyltransferase PlsX [Bacteroidota bacterium]|nr:phosphate acyltransferase PlsX [Bacteroidota bacterium]